MEITVPICTRDRIEGHYIKLGFKLDILSYSYILYSILLFWDMKVYVT